MNKLTIITKFVFFDIHQRICGPSSAITWYFLPKNAYQACPLATEAPLGDLCEGDAPQKRRIYECSCYTVLLINNQLEN